MDSAQPAKRQPRIGGEASAVSVRVVMGSLLPSGSTSGSLLLFPLPRLPAGRNQKREEHQTDADADKGIGNIEDVEINEGEVDEIHHITADQAVDHVADAAAGVKASAVTVSLSLGFAQKK